MFTERVRTFACPNCNEIISEGSDHCRFWAIPIDSETAMATADSQELLNKAHSDASYLEVIGAAMFGFLALSWLQLLFIFFWGFVITFVLLPILLIRWQIRFSRIRFDDPDHRRARKARTTAFALS